jgi:hypothetical protein
LSRLAVQVAELGAAGLPAPMRESAALRDMRLAAGQLAAVPGIGFECRLGEQGGPIDLSQRFRIADDAPNHLRGLAAHQRRAAPELLRAWDRIVAFADHWQRAPDLIEEVWIEVDAGGEGARPFPSLFVHFAAPIRGNAAALEALAILADDLAPVWVAIDAAIAAAETLGITPARSVGLMLSRSGALRLTRLSPGAQGALGLLDALGWAGPRAMLEKVLAASAVLGRGHQLVLDFAPGLLPVCGLELLLASGDVHQASLSALIDWFVDRGWAEPARIRPLLGWYGALTPVEAGDAWPDAMIIAALADTGPPVLLKRYVNHLKLNLAPGAPPLAKAYLAFLVGPAA